MPTYEHLLYDNADPVATITFNRPVKRIALNTRLLEELDAALDVAEKAIYGCIQPNVQTLCDRTFGLFTTVEGCDNIVLEACFQKTNLLYGILRTAPLTCRVVLSAVYGSPPSIFKSD